MGQGKWEVDIEGSTEQEYSKVVTMERRYDLKITEKDGSISDGCLYLTYSSGEDGEPFAQKTIEIQSDVDIPADFKAEILVRVRSDLIARSILQAGGEAIIKEG